MKQTRLFKGLLVAILLVCSLYANAYNFSATSNGVTIYYNIVSSTNNTVEVTYHTYATGGFWPYQYTSINIPETVKNGGTTYTVVGIGYRAFYTASKLTSVTIPSTVTYIDSYAFYECSALESVTLPDGLTSLGSSAFYRCSKLQKINLPLGISLIRDCTFWNCTNLESVEIPDNVTTIERNAFTNCSAMTSLTFGKSLRTIGNAAFSGCSSLTGELKIPDGVTSIGINAFQNCSGFTGELIIPDGVTEIGESTFAGCTGLTSITIPKKMTSLGYNAFRNENLKSVYSLNPSPPTCGYSSTYGDVFEDVDYRTCILYVPIGSYSAYATASQWQYFVFIEEMDMTGIESVSADNEEVIGYYTLDGKAVDAPQRGVNIFRYSDGSTKKVIVK